MTAVGDRAAWDDRQALARQVADLRDENDDLRKRLRESQVEAARYSVESDCLAVEAEDRGLTIERIDQIADEAWAAIDRRYWS
jgi:hypothetical protein